MRFDISYTTTFRYPGEVVESQNELRAAPVSDDRQQLLHYDVRTKPSSRVTSYTDYWGTHVDAFGIRGQHQSLEVVAEATVEVAPPPVLTASPRWSEVNHHSFRDQHLEYLDPSAHATWRDGIARVANDLRERSGDDVVETVLAFHRLLGTGFTYVPGSTFVGIDAEKVLESREGVCQDFAHLMIAMCRAVGVPARYVSGYLFARDGEVGRDPEADRIEVQTHAWVEVGLPGAGWWGLDPTNRQRVGERHVVIGRGRDYDDVSPLRGVYTGPRADRLEVSVHMRRFTAAQQAQQQQ